MLLMAFPVAGGYTNLANGVFSPVIYSKTVQKKFRRISVVEDITNTDYAGEISDFGDTVKIIKEPEITVNTYARGTTITVQDLVDEELTMVVDQANYFAFSLDDIEVKHAHVNWMDLASDRAAFKLKDAFDANVLLNMEANLSAAAPDHIIGGAGATNPVHVALSGGDWTPLNLMNRMSRLLDEAEVPTDNRWFVADPVFYELLMDENSKLVNANEIGDSQSVIRNGRVTEGTLRGFKLYKSTNLPSDGAGSAGSKAAGDSTTILAGHMSAVSTAMQLTKTEVYRSPTTFADICRGMQLFGRKVLRPEALVGAYYATAA